MAEVQSIAEFQSFNKPILSISVALLNDELDHAILDKEGINGVRALAEPETKKGKVKKTWIRKVIQDCWGHAVGCRPHIRIR